MRYASALASPNFLFPTGTLWALGDFLGGPSCSLRMLFYWICPLVTPTPCQHWGIFWEGHHEPWDVVLLLCPLVTLTPTLPQLGLLLPLSTHHSLTYPFHTTRSGSASLTSS